MEKKEFEVNCSVCGKRTTVPFEPKEGRPVKCRDCFKNSRPFKKNSRWKKEFDVKCAECGKDTTVPFKPTQGKPVLCRDCFRK